MKTLSVLAAALFFLCLGGTIGCSKKEEPKAADPEALKREFEELQKARKKEGGKTSSLPRQFQADLT